MSIQKTEASNLLAFGNYSYSGMEKDKFLFTPTISLIHIKTTKLVS